MYHPDRVSVEFFKWTFEGAAICINFFFSFRVVRPSHVIFLCVILVLQNINSVYGTDDPIRVKANKFILGKILLNCLFSSVWYLILEYSGYYVGGTKRKQVTMVMKIMCPWLRVHPATVQKLMISCSKMSVPELAFGMIQGNKIEVTQVIFIPL
jgi:hypothetical protein